MSSAARRAPELRPRMLGGRALPAARHMRVRVDPAGAVVIDEPAGGSRVVASPGEVGRVLLLDYGARRLERGEGYTGSVLALCGADGAPLLAVRLLDWWPFTYSSDADALEVTGARAIAAALGLPIEPAEAAVPSPAALRRALVRPYPPRPFPGRAAPWLGWIGLGFALLVIGAGGTWIAAAGTAIALLLTAPVQVPGSRARAEARAAEATPTPVPPGAVEVRPAPEGPMPRGLVEAALHLGRDDIVVVDRGRELWLPGPAKGGPDRVAVEPTVVRFFDAGSREYLRLECEVWAPTAEERERLADRLREAGLFVVMSPFATTGPPGSVAQVLSGTNPPSNQVEDTERGDATRTGPWVAGFAIAVASCTAVFGTLTWNPVLGGVLAVVALGLLALRLSDACRMRRSDRRALRTIEAPVPEGVR